MKLKGDKYEIFTISLHKEMCRLAWFLQAYILPPFHSLSYLMLIIYIDTQTYIHTCLYLFLSEGPNSFFGLNLVAEATQRSLKVFWVISLLPSILFLFCFAFTYIVCLQKYFLTCWVWSL